MAFKPNYGRDRAERARAARALSEQKQRKKDEKTALRKAQRAEAEPPTEETNPSLGGKAKLTHGLTVRFSLLPVLPNWDIKFLLAEHEDPPAPDGGGRDSRDKFVINLKTAKALRFEVLPKLSLAPMR